MSVAIEAIFFKSESLSWYGGFGRPDLNTAAGSARRIFSRKVIVHGRSISEAWHRQWEN